MDPCFASWAQFLVRTWSGDPAGVRRVLDVCCGTGLLAEHLIAHGLHVVGLDASTAMLQRARHRLGPGVSFVEACLPDLPAHPDLAIDADAIVSTYDGLNYLALADFRSTLCNLADVLRPGGWLVFDVHDDAMLEIARDNPVVLARHNDDRISIVYVVDEATRTCRSVISLASATDPARDYVEEHVQYLHRRVDVAAALTDAGFRVIGAYDDYSSARIGPQTRRATWVARRPA